jgi:hypothetical protein
MCKSSASAAVGGYLLLSFCICFPSFAQQHHAQIRPAQEHLPLNKNSALTYSVYKYLQAEQLIEEALSQGLTQNLELKLAENFIARTAGSSFDKSQWLRSKSRRSLHSWTIRELSVQVHDDLCIVSFLRVSPQQTNEQQFIVDIWRDSTEKLLNRYEFPVGQRAIAQPIKPDGKG